MTEFLVRTFVKDYKETENLVVRTRYGLLGSIVGICCNLILFTAKLLTGLMVNSISAVSYTHLGTLLTLAGGTMWGFSGTCGQFLLQTKGLTSNWLVPVRLLSAGALLLFICWLKDGRNCLLYTSLFSGLRPVF